MKRFCIIILIGLFLIQCKKEKNSCSCKSEACTEVFITLSINIKDQHSNPVVLDSFKTIKSANQLTLDLITEIPDYPKGTYSLISDRYLEKNNLCSEDYIFKGWIKDSLVIEKTFPVKNNCCHVEFTTPQKDIIISL